MEEKSDQEKEDDEAENTENEYFSKSEGVDSEGDAKGPKIIMMCRSTKYVVVKVAGKLFLDFHLTRNDKADWDLTWQDHPVSIHFIKKMKPNQRVNHFPGIYNLARKNMLGRHLMRMQRLLPNDYEFFPTTYCLPHDYKDFVEETRNQKHPRTFIAKPED